MSMIGSKLPPWSRITPMSGLTAALSLIRSLVLLLLLLELGSLLTSLNFWKDRRWGHVDHVRPVGEVQSCRGFCSVPGPFQSVQRAEMWGVILALQFSDAVHLDIDNLGVVRHVGRPLSGRHGSIPFELVNDGDLLLLIEHLLHLSGLDTVRISKG